MPRMAVTGAVIAFVTLPSARAGFSRSFAAGDLTKTIRNGHMLAEVGPNFVNSYTCCNSASSTGSSRHTLCERARRNMRSWPSVLNRLVMVILLELCSCHFIVTGRLEFPATIIGGLLASPTVALLPRALLRLKNKQAAQLRKLVTSGFSPRKNT